MDDTLHAGSTTPGAATSRKRLLARCDAPAWPFVWRGLLPLLSLIALAWFSFAPFARDSIEASVRQQVRATLDTQGFRWVEMTVSGQHVMLAGTQPSAGAGEAALALARDVTCPTWSGLRACAADVSGRFAPPTLAAAPQPVPQPAPATAPAPASALIAAQACERELAHLLESSRIQFAVGKATIRADSNPLLDRLADAARSCPGVVHIEGHTDSVGRVEANQLLSEERADAVREALIARGVPGERLRAHGFGAADPIADNDTPEGRAANRRIELHAEPY
jgi:outer membrane protein OmpA-like peptidoglycan-associated protein